MDCDLLFQNDPLLCLKNILIMIFIILIVLCLYGDIENGINVGKGYRHTTNTIRFLDFLIDNNLNLTWLPWKKYKWRNKIINGIDWSYCQDFPNCVYNNKNKLPIPLKIDVGYKFNYFTSTWGFLVNILQVIK